MLMQKTTPTQLRDFGLNSYESKLWAALLSRGAATAGELSDIANVPRSRAYDVLESLEKKGFLVMKIGKPIKYLAVDPEHVLERVRKRIMEEAEVQTQIINNLEGSDVLNELKLLHKTGIRKINPSEYSGVFRGRKSVISHVERAIKTAKKHVVIHTTESGLITEAEAFKSAIRKADSNSVKILIAAPITGRNKQAAKELSKHADIRQTAEKGRFYIIDGEEVVFMVTDDEVHQTYDSAIWVKSLLFASTLKKMFAATWAGMKKANFE
ncbi:TrmB family transcriptional regulator [Candidatus Woesearchaeota archaeon]|nr:TrmB family transcriptional regulator [Candidatus Woesearchaeota archaeon]